MKNSLMNLFICLKMLCICHHKFKSLNRYVVLLRLCSIVIIIKIGLYRCNVNVLKKTFPSVGHQNKTYFLQSNGDYDDF